MHADDFIRFYFSGEKNFTQLNPIEERADAPKVDVAKPHPPAMLNEAMFVIPLCFTMVLAVVAFVFSDVWTVRRDKAVTIKGGPQVPCRNCRYFTNNPYLKCAVNPFVALTEEAMKCSDYSPHDKH